MNNINEKNLYPKPYKIIDGGLCMEMTSKQGSFNRRLCNFTPRLISEITVDDGLEVTKRLRLGGRLSNGRALPEIEINGSELGSFNWLLEKWGVDCVLEVGRNVKDSVRHAIQLTSQYADKKNLYTVTGWKKIDGEWHYLLPGDEDYDVTLTGKLSRYLKGDSCNEDSVRNAYTIHEYPPVKKEVMLPLLAFVFLTPLGEFMKKAGCEPKFVLFLVGHTGTRKSTLAALFLSFFGNFTASDLPLSFRDTANSILHNAFTLKDVLTCIDDFHPSGRQEEVKLNATAQTVMRAYGDRTGRGRLRADSSLMESRAPQGNAIITAEFTPDISESGTARYFAIELKDGDVDLDCLTVFQKVAAMGLFRQLMRGYTEWLRINFLYDEKAEREFIGQLKTDFETARECFRRDHPAVHGRIPETVACLKVGYNMYLEFLSDWGMMNIVTADSMRQEFCDIINAQAEAQSKSVSADKPTHKFIRKLNSLLESGQAYVMKRNEKYEPTGAGFVGWEDEKYYYLNCDSAVKAVRRLCEDSGESFTITPKALLKQLAEEGLIEMTDNRATRLIRINGKPKRLVCLIKERAESIAELS